MSFQHEQLLQTAIDSLFKKYDIDGNSSLSRRQFQAAARQWFKIKDRLGVSGSWSIEGLLRQFDRNRDGKVTKQEFFNLVNELLNQL